MSDNGGTYKPTEHGGLKEDGTPDKRVGTGGMLLFFFIPHSPIFEVCWRLYQSLHTERLIPLRRASRVEAPAGLAVVQQAVVEQAV
jgi:hypothetical protein